MKRSALLVALAACLLGFFGVTASDGSRTTPDVRAVIEPATAGVVAPVVTLPTPRATRDLSPALVWGVLAAAVSCPGACFAFGRRDRRRPARVACRHPSPRLRGPPR